MLLWRCVAMPQQCKPCFQEKLSGYEADDPFVHQLVAQVQEVFDDIKVVLSYSLLYSN